MSHRSSHSCRTSRSILSYYAAMTATGRMQEMTRDYRVNEANLPWAMAGPLASLPWGGGDRCCGGSPVAQGVIVTVGFR